MTLNDFIAKYNGRVVADGQCGNLVRQYWIEVDQTGPPSYPDSKDYWSNDVPGYDKVSSLEPGDIAIYNGHGNYPEGHSAIYVGNGQVFEQNADPDGAPAHIYSRANTYLLGYLRKQGGDEPMFTEGDADNLVNILTGHAGDDEDHALAGQSFHDATYALFKKYGDGVITARNQGVLVAGDLANFRGVVGAPDSSQDAAMAAQGWHDGVYAWFAKFGDEFKADNSAAAKKLAEIKQIVDGN